MAISALAWGARGIWYNYYQITQFSVFTKLYQLPLFSVMVSLIKITPIINFEALASKQPPDY